jgi:hypothetical protein
MRQAVRMARIDIGWVSVSVTHHSSRQRSRLITGPKETSCACRFSGLRAVALTHPTSAGHIVDDVGAALLFAVPAQAVQATRQERKAISGCNEDAQHGGASQRVNSVSPRLTGEEALL